jgi:TRAP-type C4-dicarboxylate transport system permease small subunit
MSPARKGGLAILSPIDKVNSAMQWVGVAAVLLLTLVVTREVFLRYVFNSPSRWTVEVSQTIQVLYGYLCAGYVLRRHAHITWESIFDYVQPKIRAMLLMMGSILGIFFCGIMAYYSWLMVAASFRSGEYTYIMVWPMFLIKSPVLIGFILLGAQYISDTEKYYQLLRGNSSAKVQEKIAS